MRETEPTDSLMFSSPSQENGKIEERRSLPRKTLRNHVVLVFFGEDNWGKLTNMSESGMAIEFAKPPSLRERIKFTLQAMGCMPMPRNGKALGDSFEAPGEIVWTREFERGAGVHFVDLAETSRQQIREWLSLEASTNASKPAELEKPGPQPILAELLPSIAPEADSHTAEEKKKTLHELDMPVPFAEVQPESDFAFVESSVAGEPHEAPGGSDRGEPAEGPLAPELPVTSHPSVARLTFLVVAGCLATFVVTAGVKIYMIRAAHVADAQVRASDSALAPARGEPAEVASPVPAPGSSSANPAASSAASAPPFQVDVLDANGRNWILWFVHGEAKSKEGQLASKPAQPSSSSASSAPKVTSANLQGSAPPETPQVTHTFTMVAPNVSHPPDTSRAGEPPAEAPAMQPEMAPSSGNPLAGLLGNQVKPAAPVLPPPTGGMVQEPRLIRTAPLVYPQLAKTSRLSGDVLVDALIDTQGNVTAVKVISGAVLLQEAAMDTVRQWKYEPARLDGQAVAMHLAVTVRFRLN